MINLLAQVPGMSSLEPQMVGYRNISGFVPLIGEMSGVRQQQALLGFANSPSGQAYLRLAISSMQVRAMQSAISKIPKWLPKRDKAVEMAREGVFKAAQFTINQFIDPEIEKLKKTKKGLTKVERFFAGGSIDRLIGNLEQLRQFRTTPEQRRRDIETIVRRSPEGGHSRAQLRRQLQHIFTPGNIDPYQRNWVVDRYGRPWRNRHGNPITSGRRRTNNGPAEQTAPNTTQENDQSDPPINTGDTNNTRPSETMQGVYYSEDGMRHTYNIES